MSDKNCRMIVIDAEKREIREAEYTGLESLQAAVGGLITTAFQLENGDTCFVDDEGLLKDPQDFFGHREAGQLFAGNGVIVGAEVNEITQDCASSIESLSANVVFMPVERAREFMDIEPQMGFITID